MSFSCRLVPVVCLTCSIILPLTARASSGDDPPTGGTPDLAELLSEVASTPPEPPKTYRHVVDRLPPQRWINDFLPEPHPDDAFPAYFTDLEKAERHLRAGRFVAARLAAESAGTGGSTQDAARAARIRAEALRARGDVTPALDVLKMPAFADALDVRLLRAVWTADVGTLRSVVDARPDDFAARVALAEAFDDVGEWDAATAEYAWFVDPQGADVLTRWARGRERAFETTSADASSNELTLAATAVDRWATRTAAYAGRADLHATVLDMFVAAYDVVDRDDPAPRVAAAAFQFERGDLASAKQDVDAVLQGWPGRPDALALAGRIAAETFDFARIDEVSQRLRSIDPVSPLADSLDARSLLRQKRHLAAAEAAGRAVKAYPSDRPALALLAAARMGAGDHDTGEAMLDEIARQSARYPTGLLEVAWHLAFLRQYDAAERMFLRAAHIAPWSAAPQSGLGLLYTDTGRDESALKALTAARAIDPFDLRAHNHLLRLDQIASFATVETEHFVVRHDAVADPLVGELFGEYLESVHDELVARFGWRPRTRTRVEVYPTQAGFSVRTVGGPWIGATGSSTGPVIALVSPRPSTKGRRTLGPYNWAEVLRHEYAHTLTLGRSNYRIEHWMTEGLAVLAETPRVIGGDAANASDALPAAPPTPVAWVPMLADAARRHATTDGRDGWFTLEGLTWAFVRPRRPFDRQLAYAQSAWVCFYLAETYGEGAIGRMLDAAGEGQNFDRVLSDVFGTTRHDLESAFAGWAAERIDAWGYDPVTSAEYETLRERGDGAIDARDFAAAAVAWERAAVLRPLDELPARRLAGVYLRLNRPADAARQLDRVASVQTADSRFARRAARLHLDLGTAAAAERSARMAVGVAPYDAESHDALAEALDALGRTTDAAVARSAAARVRALAAR